MTGALAGMEHPLAIPVILAITGLAAAMAAAIVSVEAELLASITTALRAIGARATPGHRPSAIAAAAPPATCPGRRRCRTGSPPRPVTS